jgi:hypothetical protein
MQEIKVTIVHSLERCTVLCLGNLGGTPEMRSNSSRVQYSPTQGQLYAKSKSSSITEMSEDL